MKKVMPRKLVFKSNQFYSTEKEEDMKANEAPTLQYSPSLMVKSALLNIFTYSDYFICTTLLNLGVVYTSSVEESAAPSYAMSFYTLTLFSLIRGFLDALSIYGTQQVAKGNFRGLNLLWR